MKKDELPSYLEVICEMRWNNTEKRETLEEILSRFLEGDVILDERIDGKYLLIRNSSRQALQLFGDWVREMRILDTVRSRLIKSTIGEITALYFNRQAAARGKLALLDLDDGTPLGPINLQIVSDALDIIIDEVAPKTYQGRIIDKKH